uniref:Uncharacterized protein n=1 Tax=Noctiluca scintillans TaxID=2966 RepID=A0A7S1ACF1_NOCSC
MASVWTQLRRFRHRDLLQQRLLRAFERDQHECTVIQSAAFRPFLTAWAEVLLKKSEGGATADPHDVPDEVVAASKSASAEVRWLVRRLVSREAMHRGTPHFPSVLLQRGPQYPFQPYELTYLRHKAGSLRGTEMVQKIELPESGGQAEPLPVRDLWAEGCLDDSDFTDFRKAPRD